MLSAQELQQLFSTAPEPLPLAELGWPAAAASEARCVMSRGSLALRSLALMLPFLFIQGAMLPWRSFQAYWAMSALLRPQTALEQLLYLGLAPTPRPGAPWLCSHYCASPGCLAKIFSGADSRAYPAKC